jgi:hypothetical protein
MRWNEMDSSWHIVGSALEWIRDVIIIINIKQQRILCINSKSALKNNVSSLLTWLQLVVVVVAW